MPSYMGLSGKLGYPYLGALKKRILLFGVLILGSPIFGNPHMGTWCLTFGLSGIGFRTRRYMIEGFRFRAES